MASLLFLAGTAINFLAPSSLKTKLLTSDFFTAIVDTMASTSLTIECHKTVHKWEYPNMLAVGKNCLPDKLYVRGTTHVAEGKF